MINIQERISLAPYTLYQIGGPARFFVEAENEEEIKEAMRFAREREVPIFVLGRGSNVLVADKGFDGLVLRVTAKEVKNEGDRIIADAGAMMASAVLASKNAGLTGFEWGIGVPGTVGGSVRGNAGCFGYETKDVVESVRALRIANQERNSEIEVVELNNKECEFGYRYSIFKKHPELIIVSATLKLTKGNPEEIRAKIQEITKERTAKQDIGTKSCGCIFKNIPWPERDGDKKELLQKFPELRQFENSKNIPSSFLLDSSSLKGRREGSAVISPKHANFFVNEGGAAASDVAALIAIAKKEVQKKFSITLQEEIQYVGF